MKIDSWLRDLEPESEPLDWLKDTDFWWCEEADVVKVFNKEIDPDEAPGLTYKIYALNAVEEERLVHGAFRNPTPDYPELLKPLIKYAFGAVWDAGLDISGEAVIRTANSYKVTTGVSTVLCALEFKNMIDTFKEVEQTEYRCGLGTYFMYYGLFNNENDAWDEALVWLD